MMNKYILMVFVLALLGSSCKQSDQAQPTATSTCDSAAVMTRAPQAEVAALKQYLDSNRIVATADARGFYYTIQKPGSGTKPTVCSGVMVNYAGKLTNGTLFDSANGSTFGLNRLILGWQEGIPLIAPGGSITLYIPPSLGYGSQAAGSIPANSILVFNIDLVQVY